jgi:ComF family protein
MIRAGRLAWRSRDWQSAGSLESGSKAVNQNVPDRVDGERIGRGRADGNPRDQRSPLVAQTRVHRGTPGLATRLGRALLPPTCLVCAEAGCDGHDLCADCIAALPWNRSACPLCGIPMAVAGDACGHCLKKPPPVAQTHAAFRYGFPLDRLLPRFKFHRDLAAGRELAGWMARALRAIERPQALIAVPLHPRRLRERGYNQALELARPLASAFELPILRHALHRTRDTAPQAGLGALARRRNPRGAFAVGRDLRPGARLPAHVALVDDVMTTGATLYACAKALQRAGVARVDVWVMARVPPPR